LILRHRSTVNRKFIYKNSICKLIPFGALITENLSLTSSDITTIIYLLIKFKQKTTLLVELSDSYKNSSVVDMINRSVYSVVRKKGYDFFLFSFFLSSFFMKSIFFITVVSFLSESLTKKTTSIHPSIVYLKRKIPE